MPPKFKNRKCKNCGKNTGPFENYCSWDCRVEKAMKSGGKIHTPNNLPIRCISGNNLMLEISHGDHPDYKFPVHIDYVGDFSVFDTVDELGRVVKCDQNLLNMQIHETHALIYSDEAMALTIYECCYTMWSLSTGLSFGGFNKANEWKLTAASLASIKNGKYQESV